MNPNIRTNTPGHYTEMPPRSWFLYGEVKVGKTTAAANYPAPLLMNFKPENGTVEIAGDVWDYQTVQEARAAIVWFKEGKHEYRTLAWDGFTNFVISLVKAKEKAGGDPRRAHAQAADEVMPLIAEFMELRNFHRVIIGHGRIDSTTVTVKKEGGGNFYNVPQNVMQPDLPPRLRGYLLGLVDSFGYCYKAPGGGRRVRWSEIAPATDKEHKAKPGELKGLLAGTRLPLPDVTELSFQALTAAVTKNGAKP